MAYNLLISLSENDKRLILALLLVLILVFVLIGYLGLLVTKVMKWQGKKLDNAVADVVVTRVVSNKKHFKRYARKKNWRMFYKQSWIPILIIIAAVVFLIIRNATTKDWAYNVMNKDTGFTSLFFLWDFGNDAYYTKVFGIKVLAKWPALINKPHFVAKAWASYIFVPLITIGGLWYLWSLQSLIARTIRMYKLSSSAFDKSLDGFSQTNILNAQVNNSAIPPQNNNIQQ
ncbi:MAG: hypothetical protein K6F07_02375 [Bacilli bacterium]|nr:hypothetical protein [Bacilli bacterium]